MVYFHFVSQPATSYTRSVREKCSCNTGHPNAKHPTGSENGCDFFRWCDEPASLGPLRPSLEDLLDERHCVNYQVGLDSVRAAFVRFTEATFFLNVIAVETELKNKQVQESGCQGFNVHSKACGEAMTTTEILLLDVMKALPDEQEITIEEALRNKARLGRAALGPRQLSAAQFDEVCALAQSLGLADMHQRRAGAGAGRQQRVLAKRALTEESRKAAEDLQIPARCFPTD